jgi:hypothetical protein
MRKYCTAETPSLEIFTNFQVLRVPDYKNRYVCCICAYLVLQRLDVFYSYSMLRSLSVRGRCPVDMDFIAPRIAALHTGPKNKIAIFSETAVKILF